MFSSVTLSAVLLTGVFSPELDKFQKITDMITEKYIYTSHLTAPRTLALPASLLSETPRGLQQTLIQNSNNWEEVKKHHRNQVTQDPSSVDSALKSVVDWLGDNHSVYFSAIEAKAIKQTYGDLPCLNYALQATPTRATGLVKYEISAEDPRVGIILIEDFAGFDRSAGVKEALDALTAKGAKAFVIDLRGNPGGLAVEMMRAAGFFQSGFLWRMRLKGSFPIPLPALGNRSYGQVPLALVIDRHVNSAAEGFSGGLQRVGRARVFGETSAGNVEAIYPYCFNDGSMLFLASGQLAPFSGKTWEGVGVVPDEPGTTLRDAVKWAAGQIKP
ncbi:S41 family peptidase [Deinococcus cellulosilyticus]|nr:S41 family peptidase [Deinococcus cellulosilyticus]